MNEKERALKELIIELAPSFKEEQINHNTNLIEDLMLDSISIMRLVVNLENKFDIELNDSDLVIEKLIIFSELLKLVTDGTM
ncbi:MAG: phosphopantetheine-binding protein [Clostridia bacterium]|nr:phosphopantetheine-binding protein [Clostridia bacterium]